MIDSIKLQLRNLNLTFWAVLLFSSLLIILPMTFYKENIIILLASLCGIFYAFFAGQGKFLCFIFGLLYCVFYTYISYETKLYGEMLLTLLYIPLNLFGIFSWVKNQDSSKTKIQIQALTTSQIFSYLFILVLISVFYGIFLSKIDAKFPFLNAFSTIAQILAFYLQIHRYKENYLIVTLANIILCYIWLEMFLQNPVYIAQTLNMFLFLFLGIFYYFKWHQEFKRLSQNEKIKCKQ